MSSTPAAASLRTLLLIDAPDPARVIVWRGDRAVRVGEFVALAEALAAQLPARGDMVNLCEDRFRFLVALAAAMLRGHTVLLPASRAKAVVDEVMAAHEAAYLCDDARVDATGVDVTHSDATHAHATHFVATRATPITQPLIPAVPEDHIVVRGYTSGSTGRSKPHDKRWASFYASTAHNAAAIRARLDARGEHGRANIVATVPPQHMYGMETSVLLPLVGDMAVHAARPLFPADVARALEDMPAPRVLVATPVHLRAIVESGQPMPPIALVVSATAPLDAALAAATESALATEVLELFGSTETCVIASRRTAVDDAWQLYDGVELTPEPDGTRVSAPWYDAANLLQDVVELLPDRRFRLRGRNADLLEIAGKRASLADLTRRVLSVPGVQDAVVFQPDSNGSVRRVAALVVAPGLAARDITERLRDAMDSAFLPRPIVMVDRLPRNEVGKLPRERLLAALARESS